MSDIDELNERNEIGDDDDETGTDVMNNNYKKRKSQRTQEKQHLRNISLPCTLYSSKDVKTFGDRNKSATSERLYHIEISEENHEVNFDPGSDFAVVYSPPPEQGMELVVDAHLANVIGVIQGSDIQKMGFMIKVIKKLEDMLVVIKRRFDGAENKMDSSMYEINIGVKTIQEGIERIEETCLKLQEKEPEGRRDNETQTDVVECSSSTVCGEGKLIHRNSTQEFSISQEEVAYPYLKNLNSDDCKKAKFITTENMVDVLGASKEDMHEPYGEEYIEMVTLEQPSENSQDIAWKIEPATWHQCIRKWDEDEAYDLLKQRILPDQEMIDKACSVFGRTSTVISEMCSAVCLYLTEKSTGKITNIWPAYEYSKQSHETREIRVAFVVIKDKETELDLGVMYRTYEREAFKCSSESLEVNKLESDFDITVGTMAALTSCVDANSVSLMNSHSNLTMVSASYKLSKGFNTSKRMVQNSPCVVLYVHIKGLVPLQEEPFPEEIGQYPVDVREAVFKPLLGGRPNELHENLRMGCAIRNRKVDHHGNCSAGTLGGFLEHPQFGSCCITCAHVLCEDLQDLQHCHNGVRYWEGNDCNIQVFQPCCPGSPPFGNLICAVYNPGGLGHSGVDVAVIKIDSRHPIDGYFPDTNKTDQARFSVDKPMSYCNGKVCDIKQLNKSSVVIKYGCCTEITRGVFRLQGGAVRTTHSVGQHGDFGFRLHNQIEIFSAGEDIFAEEGDSGSFVFVEENDELLVIGILEGGMGDGRYIVTPMQAVLKALNLPQEGSLKTFNNDSIPLSPVSDRLQPQQVSFRCSTPQLPRLARTSRSDSAISMNTSYSEESASLLLLVEEKLKATDEDITQEVAKHASELKLELSESIDKKLTAIKADLKQEIQNSQNMIDRRMQEQNYLLQQILSKYAPCQNE